MKKRLIWTGSILVGVLALLLFFAATVELTPGSAITAQAVDLPPTPRPIQHQDFWSAMGEFDHSYSGSDRRSGSDLDRFALSAGHLISGDLERAAESARQLASTTTDSIIRLYAGDIHLNALIGKGEWSTYLATIPSPEEMAAGDSSARRCPDERLLAEGWRLPPSETWSWEVERMVLPLKLNRVGHPMVEVQVNGTARWFIIDTGADMSVITSKLAAEAGVEPLLDSVGRVGTSNSHSVEVRPASIRELQVGDLTIHNHRVLYLDSRNLEFKLWKFPLFKIEGILGWNLVRQLRLEIDFGNGVVVMEKPDAASKGSNPDPNLIWAGESNPLVRMMADDGTPLWFFLDTGANQTRLHHHIYDKLDLTIEGQNRSTAGEAGGFEVEVSDEVADFSLHLSGHRFDFPMISVRHRQVPTTRYGVPELWFTTDGILGFDIACQGRMVIDLPGGRFEIQPAVE